MNYFEHHIGDYAQATAHLTFVEDAAYHRLLRKMYADEKPLPVDVKAVQRLVAARTKEERQAVADVLEEFFELRDDGWHQDRADREIAQYLAGEPEREVKKTNEANRLRAHREERARLFERLTAAGLHAAWNISIGDLRALVSKLPETPTETSPATAPETKPATAPATPATATQTPDTRHHTQKERPYPPDGGSSTPNGDRPPLALVPAVSKGPAPCPHEAIVEAFHRLLPDLPRVAAMSTTRKAHLAARWKFVAKRQSVAWWEKLFAYIGESPFLLGHSKPRDGSRPFLMTLEWLTKSEENLLKVVEGNYHEAQG